VERGRSRAERPLETRTPGPKHMIREVRREGGVQHTESAVVVDVDDEISWCWDFNRQVCKGDGS